MEPANIPTDTSRIPTLPVRPTAPGSRGPYRTEQGGGAVFIIDAAGQEVGWALTQADAQAQVDVLNGVIPDDATVEVSR